MPDLFIFFFLRNSRRIKGLKSGQFHLFDPECTLSDHELSDDSDTEVKETLQQMDNMDDEEEVQDDSIAQVK